MAIASAKMGAKEAIRAAFDHFDDLFSDADPIHVLLEGVSFNDAKGQWVVAIGFETGRTRRVKGEPPNLFGQVVEPVREVRKFHLADGNGDLIEVS